MPPAAPTVARGLAAFATGLLGAGGARALMMALGAGTAEGASGAASVLLAGALVGLVPSTRRRAWQAGLLLLPPGFLLLLEQLVAILGAAGAPPTALLAPLLAIWIGALLPAAAVARRLPGRAGPGGPVGIAAGSLGALALPPVAAALLAVILLLGAERIGRIRQPAPATDEPRGLAELPALLLVAAGLVHAAGATRGLSDPSAAGLLAVAVGGLLGLGLGRALSPAGAGARLGAAGLLLLALHGLVLFSPDAVRDLTALAPGVAFDGRLLLALLPALAGLLGGIGLGISGGRTGRPLHGLGVGIGLLAGLYLPGDAPLPALAVLLGAGGLLVSAQTPIRLAGLGIAALGVAATILLPAPDTERLAIGAWRVLRDPDAMEKDAGIRGRQRATFSQAGPGGSGTVRTDEALFEGTPAEKAVRWPVTVELEGLVAFGVGREAEAEKLGALLGDLLAPEAEKVLLLGDATGTAAPLLLDGTRNLLTIATPQPGVVRAVADLDPVARRAWLDPAVHLRPAHPEAVLRTVEEQDLVVEIIRAPWRDAARAAPDRAHLRAVARRLAPGGRYVLVMHLGWWPVGGPARVAADLAEIFPHVQLVLPPSGADSLILVAGETPPSLASFLEGAKSRTNRLRELGIRDPELLASFVIGDRASAGGWAEARPSGFSAWMLSPVLFQRPVLHLDDLSAMVAPAAHIWDTAGAEAALSLLDERLAGRRLFLELLGDAARGEMGEVLESAAVLSSTGGELGARALETLIEPHLSRARLALERAQAEGSSSSGWEEAWREASTARTLAPTSASPALLLAEIALAQGNLNNAVEMYEAVLKLEPRSLSARSGLARVAMLRRDFDAAEEQRRLAVAEHPQDWGTWWSLGVLLMERDRFEDAEEALKRASDLAGGIRPEPQVALAETYLGMGRASTALVHAERAVVLKGGGYALYVRGRAWFDLGQLDKAEDDFRRAVLEDPQLVVARGAIGQIRAMKGDLQAATEAFRAVLALDPGNDAARENLRRAESALREKDLRGPDGKPIIP